ncbi:hypothetical protein EJB05_40243, partial [Eragrostis curvula]
MLTLLAKLTGVSDLARWLRPCAPPPSTSQEDQAGVPSMEPAVQAHEGVPLDYTVSVEITSVPSSSGELPVEHAAATQCDVIQRAVPAYQADDIRAMKDTMDEFKAHFNMTRMKIHRYPATIRTLGEKFTDPTVVAIGLYYHGRGHLRPMEKVKRVAVYQLLEYLGSTFQTMYNEVVSVVQDARSLYEKEVGAGISDDSNFFTIMMFHDACFLVQYMRAMTQYIRPGSDAGIDSSLQSFFYSKGSEISHDIMLLENQVPWRVVQAVMRFVWVDFVKFIKIMVRRYLHFKVPEGKTFSFDGYEPPHLLGLLRFYMVRMKPPDSYLGYVGSDSADISINKLAEIGLTLAPNKTNHLMDMGVEKKGPLSAEVYLSPLSLDGYTTSMLINMAAHEVCTTPNYGYAYNKDLPVCSYLQLLATLVRTKEDVRELRTRKILIGVAFTDKHAFDFISGLRDLPLGSFYRDTIERIDGYRITRRTRTKVYAFFHRNWKTIATVFSAIAAIAGILKLLQPLVIKGS